MFKKICLIIFALYISLNAMDGKKVLKQVNSRFEKLTTLEIDYKQIQKWDLAKEESSSNGKIYFKKPNTFRIESGSDFVLSDGKTVYRYSKSNNQVLIEKIKSDDDLMLPGEMFFSFSKKYDLQDAFEKSISGEKYRVLKLSTKKGEEKFINKITAYINDEDIASRLEYEDLDDNKTTLVMTNIQIDKKISEDKFTFKSMPNVEIVDLRK